MVIEILLNIAEPFVSLKQLVKETNIRTRSSRNAEKMAIKLLVRVTATNKYPNKALNVTERCKLRPVRPISAHIPVACEVNYVSCLHFAIVRTMPGHAPMSVPNGRATVCRHSAWRIHMLPSFIGAADADAGVTAGHKAYN